ncbi:DNA primase [Streptomyces sp. NPDC058964]|uniref:DNA primase n=1 Tax=Streptomyces sp. NPDC058964 TaxID=3346681 RepID=UPI0036C28F63
MNRIGLGLALGAGYVLGRTKKMKMALALGSVVAGKRLHLSPRMVTDLVSKQLQDNPQFKEIGEQLRDDLRGVGKAASGAMVERQMEALADRLHGRTSEVRDQLEGLGDTGPEKGSEESESGEGEEETAEEAEGREETGEAAEGDGAGSRTSGKETARTAARKAPGRDTAAAKRAAKKAPAKRAAQKAPAKNAAAKETTDRKKTADRKKTSSGGSAARGARARLPKEGGES